MIRAFSRTAALANAAPAPTVARQVARLSTRLASELRSAAAQPSHRTFSAAAASKTKKSVDFKDPKFKKYVKLAADQKLVILGFGAIGQGVLPLLYRHLDMRPDQVLIVSNEFNETQLAHAADYGAKTAKHKLTRTDYLPALQKLVKKGDFLINVSIDVSSVALIEHCQTVGALYLDTCNEPWAGGYSDPSQPANKRSNYAFREQALEVKQRSKADGPTALITHGANPGIVSHFVKQALMNIAKDTNTPHTKPKTREEWVDLMEKLGVKSIHIAEKDTQASKVIKHDQEFVNTWSIEGLVEEGKQPAELGWGTHETTWPADGKRHPDGCQAAIYLDRPGALTKVRSWTPKAGPFHGWLITHTEAISIADYFTKKQGDKVVYRPTVHFAYHPSADAVMSMHEVVGREWIRQPVERVMMDELVSGRDELGVLLLGHKKNAYWYGSDLTIDEARRVAPNNNATSLQVCTSVLSGVVWSLENPRRGIIEPEEIEFDRCLEISAPYFGELAGFYSDWSPLDRRGLLFPETVDTKNKWSFQNFIV